VIINKYTEKPPPGCATWSLLTVYHGNNVLCDTEAGFCMSETFLK